MVGKYGSIDYIRKRINDKPRRKVNHANMEKYIGSIHFENYYLLFSYPFFFKKNQSLDL